MKYIVKGKEYKVKDGDSLDSIAKANGITVSDLAKFNFKTTDPKQFNRCLRDKVGCRKTSKDGKDYVMSSQDDPGIIYIPQDLPKTNYASKQVHTIKLKVPVQKQYKTSFCLVKFRPKHGWKGEEYGFDWFREGDFAYNGLLGDLNYHHNVIGKLYVPKGQPQAAQTIQKDSNSYEGDFRENPAQLKDLKAEYKRVTLQHPGKDAIDSFTSYINIYNDDKNVPLPKTFEVQAFVSIEDETLEQLSFDLGDPDGLAPASGPAGADDLQPLSENDFIKISCSANLKGMAVVKSKPFTLNIQVKKPLTRDFSIIARAHTRNTDGSVHITSVGKLLILKNDKSARRYINLLLVQIITPKFTILGSPAAGNLTNQENLFTKLLRQALINPRVEKPAIILDLSKDKDFVKLYTIKDNNKRVVMAYDWKKGVGNKQLPGRFDTIEDFLDARLKKQLADKKSTINIDNYIRAYYFGESGGAKINDKFGYLNGYANSSGNGGIAVMFKTMNEGTSPHEFMHTLGLPHTFDCKVGGGISANAEFTYKPKETENIMDYTHHRTDDDYNNMRLTTWHWQWKVMFGNASVKHE